jgi:Fe-S oxidoreductase
MTQCGSLNQDTGEALVETTTIVQAMRADFLQNHPEWIDPAYQGVLQTTRQYNNPWGLPRTAREKWAHRMGLKHALQELAPVLLFIGCTMASSQALSEQAKKAAEILQQAGVDFAILGKDEPCCGSVQKRIGDPALAGAMRDENISLFNRLGCTTIVTLCAGCSSMLKKEYADAPTKLEPKVVHIVEFLPELMKEKRLHLKKTLSLRAAYHDPCHLGRYQDIYDEPREILNALPGVTLLERTATRENTICCGAGGGMRVFESGVLAEQIGRTAVESAAATGAEVLVTACPFCEMHLDAAAKNVNSRIRICDILDLVHKALV